MACASGAAVLAGTVIGERESGYRAMSEYILCFLCVNGCLRDLVAAYEHDRVSAAKVKRRAAKRQAMREMIETALHAERVRNK